MRKFLIIPLLALVVSALSGCWWGPPGRGGYGGDRGGDRGGYDRGGDGPGRR